MSEPAAGAHLSRPVPQPATRLLLALVVLELSSGLPMGFVADFVPVWARATGASREVVGLLGALGGIWSAKILFAPFVDSLFSFKRWGLAALAGLLSCAVLGAALPSAVGPVLVALALFGGLQDVAFDGWLIAATPPELLGRVSGLRVASYRAAMAVGGGAAIWLGGRAGWTAGWWLLAALLSALLLGVVALRPPVAPAVSPPAHFLRELLRWLTRRDTLVLAGVAVLFRLGDAAAATMTRAFWVDAHLSTDDIGLLGALGGSVLTAVGAVFGGELTQRLGLRRGLAWLGASMVVSNALYALVALQPSRWAVLSVGAFEALTVGLGGAPLVALLIRGVGTDQPATRFSAITAVLGLSRALASVASGYGATRFGYAGYFALTVLLGLPGVLLAPRVARGT